ncbi:hypothetical protein FB45DRAFT_395507 [Roridomyces roridus]|uniref:Secreted protein n=1 Tax=Roridomyces roridus TaxID=1738132 RepID=A0AAD7FA37_9AGAR|nr:hypothetical protein FB45DRAFT_395507 [Roridomyces roridus]
MTLTFSTVPFLLSLVHVWARGVDSPPNSTQTACTRRSGTPFHSQKDTQCHSTHGTRRLEPRRRLHGPLSLPFKHRQWRFKASWLTRPTVYSSEPLAAFNEPFVARCAAVLTEIRSTAHGALMIRRPCNTPKAFFLFQVAFRGFNRDSPYTDVVRYHSQE